MNVADRDSLTDSDHPLNNVLVLQKIFQYLAVDCSVQDLKNVRLVTNASNWQTELQKVWRRDAMLVLHERGVLEAPVRESGISVLDYVLELVNPDSPYGLMQVPFERVELRGVRICLPISRAKGLASTFWDKVGPFIKHLKLGKVGLEINGNIEMVKRVDVLRFLCVSLPSLESLTLENIRETIVDGQGNVPYEDLVLPNLDKLVVASGSTIGLHLADTPNLKEIQLSGFVDIEPFLMNVTDNCSVKKLDLIGCRFDEVGQDVNLEFSAVHFTSLEHLKAYIHGDDFIGAKTVITAHSQTLDKLELFRWIGNYILVSPIIDDFPALRELHLWGNVVTDLSFLRFTPNLELLHVDVFGLEKREEMRQEVELMEQVLSFQTAQSLIGDARALMEHVVLSKLQYCQLNLKLGSHNVRILAEWMPNLKTFKSVLDSPTFQEVGSAWTRLECLECLIGSVITDEDLVGLGRPHNGLGGLKRFVYRPECNTSALTDKCTVGILLQLPQLISLELVVSMEFTDAAMEQLRESIRDVKISRVHSLDGSCCQDTAFKHYLFAIQPRAFSDYNA